MTTRFPSICPSTFAFSPRISVCSEMTFPFTLPSMRNVPVTVRVPSIVTPWSMKPVHSSLLPLPEVPGHFHAIIAPKDEHSHFNWGEKQVNDCDGTTCRITD